MAPVSLPQFGVWPCPRRRRPRWSDRFHSGSPANSAGFKLWPRGDGRRVEVRAGSDVVAEVWVTDESHELRLDDSMVADADLEAFGTALGQAIEMVAVADKDRPTERNVTGPRNWGRR